MRRFEFSEGSSNKFWQIELQGESFTVTYGKIGSDGQTQTKSFASSAAAQAEHDKLVKEKIKKGYVEITAAPAAAPVIANPKPVAAAKPVPAPAAPTPAPAKAAAPAPVAKAAASVAEEPATIVFPEGKLAELLPKRKSQPWDAKVDESFKAIAESKDFFKKVQGGLKQAAGECKKLQQAVLANLKAKKLKAKLDLEEEAALFALAGNDSFGWGQWQDQVMRVWIGHAGVEFALEAFARSTAYSARQEYVTDDWVYWLADEDPMRPRPFSWSECGYGVLREYLLTLDDAAYAKARAVAEKLRAGASLTTRSFLSLAFIEETEWVHADLAEWPAMLAKQEFQEDSRYPAWGLAQGTTNGALLTAVLKAINKKFPYNVQPLQRYEEAFLARAGLTAEEPLLLLADLLVTPRSPEGAKETAEVLAWIKSERVAHYFAQQVGDRVLRPIALEYLRGSPRLGLKALAQAASGNSVTATTAKAALTQVVTSLADLDSYLPALPAAAQTLIEGIHARTTIKQEATDEQLPRVLVAPPWLTKVKAVAPQEVKGLTVLARQDRLDPDFQVEPEEDDKKRKKKEEDELLKQLAEAASPVRLGWEIRRLPLPSVIHVLETGKLENLKPYYSSVTIDIFGRGGLAALNGILRYAEMVDLADAMEVFPHVDSPKVAPYMAMAAIGKKYKQTAQEWLNKYPETAAIGLIPTAVGPAGKQRSAAETAIRFMASRGHSALLLSVAEKYGAPAKAALQAVLDFDPLLLVPAKVPKMPGFWKPAAFTRPLLKDRQSALPLKAVEALGTMLAFTPSDAPYAGIAQVKEACDPASLGDFAWDLFQAWLTEGAPSKEQWAFLALGHLGNDECARKLTPMIRIWPGEAAHARAVLGLDVLALIGTDVALMHLHGIGQKVKFKGLQERAKEKIDQVAEARGLSADELADRLVPDLGLDDDGSLTLDFGARSFRVTFDETLKPVVLDSTGKQIGDLPKPNKSDDAEKAASAVEIWKALKKDAKAIATNQVLRLEVAMCSERKWTPDVFRNFLLEHPVMIHLVRRLVWGVFDEQGKLTATFRVAEDRSLADEQDSTFTLPESGSIGIPHRLALSEAQASAWGQVIADYKIIQPFEQLGRQVFPPTDAERKSAVLERMKDVKVPTGKVLGMESRGWRRGAPQDAGWVWEMEKSLTGGFLITLPLGDGIGMGFISDSPTEQKLGAVSIEYESRSDRDKEVTFGALSPIAFSELVMDLERLRA